MNNSTNVLNYDTMSLEDIREMYLRKMTDKILEQYTFPKVPSSDGYYHMALKDPNTKKRRQIKSKTLDGLQEKVLAFHSENVSCQKTFKECFLVSQSQKLKYIKHKEKMISVQNTLNRNQSEYTRFFAGTSIENSPMELISKKELELVIENNLTKYNLTVKGLASMRAILNAIFSLAYSEKWIDDNVYARIDFKKYMYMLSTPIPPSERGYSEDEINRILNQIYLTQESKPKYLIPYALELQILCGFRRGEVPPLRWCDITEQYILIHREQLTIKKCGDIPEHFQIVSHTKTYKDRKYPITDELKNFLEKLKKIHDIYYPNSEFLFPADTDMGCITNNTIYNYFRRICTKEKIKISKEKIRGTHAFRRNCISKVINNSGGNLVLASELFGNSPEVARKYYYTGINLEIAKNVLMTPS